MPQMAPYSWLFLMFMFSMIFIILNSILHFNKPTNKINLTKNISLNKFNPKW